MSRRLQFQAILCAVAFVCAGPALAVDRRLAFGGSAGVAFPFGDIRNNPSATFSPSWEGLSGSLNAAFAVHRKISLIAGYNYSKFAEHNSDKKRVTFWEAGLQFNNGNRTRPLVPFFAMCVGVGKLATKMEEEEIDPGGYSAKFTANSDWHPGAKVCIGASRKLTKHLDFRFAGEFRMIHIDGKDVTYVRETTFGTNTAVERATDIIVGDITMFNLGIGVLFVP